MSSYCKRSVNSDELLFAHLITDRATLIKKHQTIVSDASIEEVIGEGACGTVYRAREIHSGKIIAIKIVDYGNDSRKAAVLQEAQVHSTLNHNNIIKLFKYYVRDMSLIMHVEYFDGVELRKFVADERFNGKRHQVKNKIMEGTKSAIQYMQDSKITHGDIHDRNVMVNCNGEVKIIDFGFAEWGETKKLFDLEKASILYRMIQKMAPWKSCIPYNGHVM